MLGLLAGLALTGCALDAPPKQPASATAMPPGAPPADDPTVIAPAESRLKLAVPTLEGGTVLFRRFVVEPGRVIEETGEWAGPGRLPATAAMILSESAAGPPPTDPHDPEEVVDLFPAFDARRAGVGLLVDSQNTVGPVHWRRAKIGTTTCVLFLQRWGGAGPQAPASTLSGYYCAPPGHILSPGAAETVIRSVGLKPSAR